MTAELWLEKRCVHGFIGCGEMICDHQPGEHTKDGCLTFSARWCPGGSRVRLDPDQVVEVRAAAVWSNGIGQNKTLSAIQVKDIIDALTKEEK